MNRSLRHLFLLASLVSGLLTTACGGAQKPADPAAASSSATTGGNSADVNKTQPAKKLKVAMLLPGKINDQGYSQTGYESLMRTKSELGAEVAYSEDVPVANQVEAYRDYASKGFDLVMGWGGQFEDGALEVGKDFPKVKFAVVNGVGGNNANYSSYDLAGEEWQWVGGYLAGLASKNGKVGYISGSCFDASARQMHGSQDGVKAASAQAQFTGVFVGDWEDPAKAKEQANAMIASGADVIMTNLNAATLGVVQAAQEAKKSGKSVFVMGEWVDQNKLGPDVVLSSVLKDNTILTVLAGKKVLDGSFDGKPFRLHLTDSSAKALADMHGLGQADWLTKSQAAAKDLAGGKVKVSPNPSCK